VELHVDGARVGEGRVNATVPLVFSADETTDVGRDTGTTVSNEYGPHDSVFRGRVHWIQIDVAEAVQDLDNLITPEERLRIAMARQ
jgi:arylsulfatase